MSSMEMGEMGKGAGGSKKFCFNVLILRALLSGRRGCSIGTWSKFRVQGTSQTYLGAVSI